MNETKKIVIKNMINRKVMETFPKFRIYRDDDISYNCRIRLFDVEHETYFEEKVAKIIKNSNGDWTLILICHDNFWHKLLDLLGGIFYDERDRWGRRLATSSMYILNSKPFIEYFSEYLNFDVKEIYLRYFINE